MKFLKGVLWTVGIVGAIVVALRYLAFKVWRIPDDPVLAASIAPTLAAGDVVLVLTRGTPGFGDLVRCPDPEEPQRFVVGRIAGSGHDTVTFDKAYVQVNNKTYRSQSNCNKEGVRTVKHPSTGADVDISCNIVEMGSGPHLVGTVAQGQENPLPSAFEKVTVQTGNVFLVSDNRDLHDDSRDFGTLPAAACAERIVFRFWSRNGWGDADNRLDVID